MSGLFTFLIIGVGSTAFIFSKNYMVFHKARNKFLLQLGTLLLAALCIAVGDNVVFILVSWIIIALLLPSLIGSDRDRQSLQAEKYIRGYLLSGTIILSIGFTVLGLFVGSSNLGEIIRVAPTLPDTVITSSMILIISACMLQSSIFPFHKWLLSSMCAPTPASAFMHAGLVSSGGILLIRLHPILSERIDFSLILFSIGCLNAYLGNLWMKARPDIKSSLGCSTISQMGFMLMQIGLGCYTSAVLHIVFHGFYKSYHFLASPSVVNLKRRTMAEEKPTREHSWFFLGLTLTFLMYLLMSDKSLIHPDASLLIGILLSLLLGSSAQKIGRLQGLSLPTKAMFSIIVIVCLTALYTSVLSALKEHLYIDADMPLMTSHVIIFGLFLMACYLSTLKFVKNSSRLHLLCLNAGSPNLSANSYK